LTQQDPVKNPLTFVFLLKQCCFDFLKKIRNDPGDPVITRNPGLRPGRV
jgi:hypothetical protein